MFESLLGAAALATTVLVGAADADAGLAVVYIAGVALPVGLGLWRLTRHRSDRFARLLIGAAALWALTSLAQSGDSTLYSTGRVAAWSVEAALVYLLLAFPTGRLSTRPERRLALATVLLVTVLYLPTALVADFPEPAPWGGCGTGCPANSFAVTEASAAVDVVRPAREVLTVLLFGAVASLLIGRARRSGPLARRTIAPVAGIALFRAFVMAFYLGSRAAADSSQFADVLGWGYMLSLPAITVALAAGFLSQRLFVADALEELTRELEPHAGVTRLRMAMAHALRDPWLRIYYWADGEPGHWVGEAGRPVDMSGAGDGRAVTEIAVDGRRLAAVVHDAELARDPDLIEAATAYALTALENDRLERDLRTSLTELRESRARIVSAADTERHRIERDLHDGAQQRLVALRIRLELLAERIESDSTEGAARLRDFEREIDATIDEVRSFARGIYPPLLEERGLADALRSAARNVPIPTTVDVPDLRRYRQEIESSVYFVCMEALQNAAKHADGASSARISVSEDGELRFEVRDNGVGFDLRHPHEGSGLTNMRDRVAAVGGSLEVRSAPGSGTAVIGSIPTL